MSGRLPSFSLVVNTLNRVESLARTLESFRWIDYRGDFEVVVVDGPSTDGSEHMLDRFDGPLRRGHCPEANLSMSRNIGIAMAAGDVVAFIDDDAIPEPQWLTQLAAAFDSPAIGAAGGTVFDHTGYAFQYRFSNATRLGNAKFAVSEPAPHFCFPGSYEFPYLQGTNAAFRRAALLEINGFDEEFDYYLDETEVCCRLVDAGFLIRQLPNAYVHHKFAPSHIRDVNRIVRHRFPVLKNKIYFSLKHGRPYHGMEEVLDDNRRFVGEHRNYIEYHVAGLRLPEGERQIFADESERAWQVGLARGLADEPRLLSAETKVRHAGSFLPFATTKPEGRRLTVALISRDYPSAHVGSVAKLTKILGAGLAQLGHEVHVIAGNSKINQVDFDAGVWVHRLVVTEHARTEAALELGVPVEIWNWSATALAEIRRIDTHCPIDLIEAPVRDCQGIAALLDDTRPIVTSLHSPLLFWLDRNRARTKDAEWMTAFGHPVLGLERLLMTSSHGIRAGSAATMQAIEGRYGMAFDSSRSSIIPYDSSVSPMADATVSFYADTLLATVREGHADATGSMA
jgi:glycogen synthase